MPRSDFEMSGPSPRELTCAEIKRDIESFFNRTNQGVNALAEGPRLRDLYTQNNCVGLGFPKIEDIFKR